MEPREIYGIADRALDRAIAAERRVKELEALAQAFRELVDAGHDMMAATDLPKCGVYYRAPQCGECKDAARCAAYQSLVLAVNGAEAALAALEGSGNGTDDVPRCRVCGCTDDEACQGGCFWVDDPEGLGDLCSRCLAGLYEKAAIIVRREGLETALRARRGWLVKCYYAKQGLLFVSDGISQGRTWSTYYRPRPSSLKRLKTMPIRETREAAQADLDAYAAAKRLPAYEVEHP